MDQIKNDSMLFGWNDKDPLVEPFSSVSKRVGKAPAGLTYSNGDPIPHIKPIPHYIKAMVNLTAVKMENSGKAVDECFKTEHIAVGTGCSESGDEVIYVEYASGKEETACISYSPNTGKVKGCVISPEKMQPEAWRLRSTVTKKTDGTAVFLALLASEMADPASHIQEALDALEEIMEPGIISTSAGRSKAEIAYENSILPACAQLYDKLARSGSMRLLWPSEGKNTLERISSIDIKNGKACPSKGKVLFGTFKILKPGTLVKDAAFYGKADLSKYKGALSKGRVFSEEDKLLIPKLPKDFIPTKEFIEICDEMLETKDNPPATAITQIFLEGGAGTGKSALGRAIAAVFGLPLEIYTCSSTDTKDDLAGTILPYVDEEKAEGLSSPEKKALEAFWKSEGSGIDAVAKALSMPNTAQCKFDPEGVYEDVLGAAPSGEIDSSDAYRILVDEITGRLKSITKKAGASGSGVRYKAMKTAIIRAIENGRLLLLEEVACVKDQGAFMFLSDIFEKEGIGVVNTIYGDIHRHPGFILVGTTNRKYKGLKPINEATRSRFQYFVKMDTPSTETIMERVGRKCGITDNVLLRNIAEVFQTCESKGAELNADGVATLRGLFSFADAVKRGKDPKAAFENYLLYAITTDPDDASEILQEVEDCEIFNV